MITAELTDDTGTLELPDLEAPVTIAILEGSSDVVTLDNNVRTDFTDPKKLVTLTYDSLTEDEFNAIKEFYDRQFTLFAYPLLTIGHYNITDMPGRMTLNPRQVYDHCGSVENVTITFRESVQLPVSGSS